MSINIKKANDFDELVSVPSGEIIIISECEISYLLNLGLIDWNNYINYFSFKDGYINSINDYLFKYYQRYRNHMTTNGKILSVIKYNGKLINNINYKFIYSNGDILFLIYNNNEKKIKVYQRHQIIIKN
jgi:hypothetical protein